MKASILFILLLWAGTAAARSDSVLVRTPVEFGGLRVWILDASDTTQHPYLTLEEALTTGQAVIHENNSQTLWIENRSDTDLFLQSGDLIKGGQQDRMIASDRILPAHETSRDLEVYCIERGRSTKRGTEPVETFSASHWIAPLAHIRLVARHDLTEQLLTPHVGGLTAPDTNELKLLQSLREIPQPYGTVSAAQQSVWNDITTMQSNLRATLKDSVTKNFSPSSLELTLENGALADREITFERHFGALARKDSHAVGFVYAIDGTIVGAEQYASHALFSAMWPKLLRSVGAEVFAMSTKEDRPTTMSAPTQADVQDFLNASANGTTSRQTIDARTLVEASRTGDATRFVTWDEKYQDISLHKEWLAK